MWLMGMGVDGGAWGQKLWWGLRHVLHTQGLQGCPCESRSGGNWGFVLTCDVAAAEDAVAGLGVLL